VDRRRFFKAAAAPVVAGVMVERIGRVAQASVLRDTSREGLSQIELRLLGKRRVMEAETEVLHRWTVPCRRRAYPRRADRSFPSPRLELWSLEPTLRMENFSGERLYVEYLEGELLDLPGLLFDSPIGSGPFQSFGLDVGYGVGYRGTNGNEGFWLADGDTVTFDWGEAPVARF